jgi:hypothetical protein
MKQIDEQRLESDTSYRYEFLADFIGFTEEDVALIHGLATKLMPLIPTVVDTTYEKLLSCDATARHFLPRQNGYEGTLPKNLDALSQETEQIQFRKEHLRRYLVSLVGNAYDARMINYLDVVGKIHTPKAGNKQIDVPLVQMNALMGLLADVLIQTILDLELERRVERKTLRAFNKLLWIQNDFINRHYAVEHPSEHAAPVAAPATAVWR